MNEFYGLMSGTCFTLVGLWWTVVQRHPEWRGDPRLRKLAGGTYLSFLLPGLMSTLALVAPETPWLWRSAFGASSVAGLVATVQLIRVDAGPLKGPFRRNRWVVAALYALILVLGVYPELVRGLGLAPVQVAGFLLVLLIVLAHGLTWEFMMEPSGSADPDDS